MKQTPNLGLIQPEGPDNPDESQISDNMALLDAEVGVQRAHRDATTGVHGITDTAQLALIGHAHPEIPSGPPGVPGPTGPQGPQGPIGLTGDQGIQGVPGPMGPDGPMGLQGPSGPQGEPGADSTVPGPAGPPGADGAVGPAGPQGEPGPQGVAGPTGPAGSTGPAGPQGNTGPQGPAGPQGIQGIPGTAGAAGATGPSGPQGNPGSPGTLAYKEWVLGTTTAIPSGEYRLTALDATITVPAGRRLKITTFVCMGGGSPNEVRLYRDGQQLNRSHFSGTAPNISSHTFSVVDTPAAGTYTYNVRTNNAVAGTLYNDGTNEAYLLIEDITYNAPAAVDVSVPVGVLAQNTYVGATVPLANYPTLTLIPGFSVNFVVPAGRTVKLSGWVLCYSTVVAAGEITGYTVYDNGVAVGNLSFVTGANWGAANSFEFEYSPSAGSHTITVQARRDTGTGTHNFQTGLLVATDVSPTPATASTAPSSTLAYNEKVSNQSAAAQADLTGLTATVTVAAGRRIRVSAKGLFTTSSNYLSVGMKIMEGATELAKMTLPTETAADGVSVTPSVVLSPSAGTHTYKIAAYMIAAGTWTLQASATNPAYILVEDITGSGVAGHTHTQLDDTGWIDMTPVLANGWVSYDANYGPPKYRKKAGIVYLQGLVKAGTLGTVIATLPVGFRPDSAQFGGAGTLLFVAMGDNNVVTRIDVYPDGRIVQAGGGTNVWQSLSSVIFPAA